MVSARKFRLRLRSTLSISVLGVFLFVVYSLQNRQPVRLPNYDLTALLNNYSSNTPTLQASLDSEHRLRGFLSVANGSLLHRISQFNRGVTEIRQRILTERNALKNAWNDSVLSVPRSQRTFIWGAADDYFERLAKNHRYITTVFLPWLPQSTNSLQSGKAELNAQWSSTADQSNVLAQNYYKWTADDKLCTWIETKGVIKARYDAIFNRKCDRGLRKAASIPDTLETLYFYAKPINKQQYWPNDGDSYPDRFYKETPSFLLYVHIHLDAVISELGDVFSGNSSVAMYVCRDVSNQPLSATLPYGAATSPLYSEVFSVAQMWGASTFHRLVEVVPRIGVFVEFLRTNPDVWIHGVETPGGRLGEILSIFGIDQSRLITGTVRASVVYQPRETGCGTANVVDAQVTSKLYRDYIAKNLLPSSSSASTPVRIIRRDRLVLIRRSGWRYFTEHDEIERRLRSVARDFDLTFELFIDNPTPSFNDTMVLFNAAVMVVGPHGAGLSNVLFSEPGTFVIEGVCNLPHVNLCFQRLSHVLGHRYHGIASRGGCEEHVDVDAAAVECAARQLLEIWKLQR